MASPKDAIRDKAHALGFDAVGVCAADGAARQRQNLEAFLGAGLHGDMAWMARRPAARADPKALWPEAESIIALGVSYAPAGDPLATLGRPAHGAISVYAHGRDYHDVLRKRLKALGRWMTETYACSVKVFVDTAPVMEKPAAGRAGIGWQGKHTNLVSRRFGSWLFLGEVFTTMRLAADGPHADLCGSCDRCIRACPTDAFPEPYRIEATRCISYLTIEHKGAIPEALRPLMGNRIYGCDDCLAVCPWNKFPPAADEPAFRPRSAPPAPRLADLAGLDEAAFREMFAGTAVKRTGRERFVRNVLIAAGNSGDPALAEALRPLTDDPSPLVREAAAWALGRLERAGRRATGAG